ncbi:MAG TPA: thiamine-phosphate kinase [Gemmatimonadales bacterium]|nr:thiamine-phosphate kinase [Gemmatimonadales bacterium]
MPLIPLGRGPEFDRIRAIAKALGPRASDLGNDCALVRLGSVTLALTTDVSVERVHFRREWLSLEEIGWRAAVASLSDLAAAGAQPIGLLAALTMAPGEPEPAFASVMSGVGAAVESVGGTVLGGDLSRGGDMSLAITAIGSVDRPIGRSGARPGDGLWVTGELGGARAALAAWRAGREPDPRARARFAHPEPRIEAGRWLAAHGARAMLDVSDGLAGDAAHLAAASGVRVRVELEKIPAHPAVATEARATGEPAAAFAAQGGEDYELLVAMPAEPADRSGIPPLPLTRIGRIEAGPAEVVFALDGRRLHFSGYDHFA